jgi:predicted Zn-dependent peptidase
MKAPAYSSRRRTRPLARVRWGALAALAGSIFFTGSVPAARVGEPNAAPAGAPSAVPSHPALFDRVEELRLDNGMLFLLLPRHDVPTVSGRIGFRVGNVDSPAGESGLAHMFEHMAFKGTDRIGTTDIRAERALEDSVSRAGTLLAAEVARRERADTATVSRLRSDLDRLLARQDEVTLPNEWPQLYDKYTFDFNAYTTPDVTVYTADLPSNNLEVWMLMESDRIRHPSMRGFYRERDVVMEERRERTEDSPEDAASDLFLSLAFTAHPYRHPVIGYMSELETLTQTEAEAFRRTFYVPGNATGVLVGDFDPVVAKREIEAYFGPMTPGPLPPEIPTVEPPQRGMRRGVLRAGTERQLFIGFHAPAPAAADAPVAWLLSDVLTRDDTSRLRKRLVIEEKVARSVGSSPDDGFQRYPGLFEIHAIPLPGVTNEKVEDLIWNELGKVAEQGVTLEKLDQIKSSHRKQSYRALERNGDLAQSLLENQMTFGDWRMSYKSLDRIDAVSPEQVKALARDLFRKDAATVVFLEPADSTGQEGGR